MNFDQKSLPLAGIKILEIGQNIAGPYAGEILSTLGAEVVKVERPKTGDDARGWGPPFWKGTATTFQAMNHGKKSITVDLQNPEEIAWLKEYVNEFDVLIQNMRPGSLEKMGLGAEELCASNPKLIYCSLGAFGHKGPMRLVPGYEPIVQAFSGIFSVNGTQEGPSTRVAMQVLDLGTGIWAALGCLAAVFQRERTGRGCVVDTSLFETALGWLQVMMAGFHATGQQPERHRSGNPNVVVFQAIKTSDGEVVVAAANDRLFHKLAKICGREDWISDPRYSSNALRVESKAALIPELEAVFATRKSEEWMEALENAGIPCAPIQDFHQVIKDPQTLAIDIFQKIPETELGIVGLPISFDGQRPPTRTRAPHLGEHNAEIIPSTNQRQETV